MNSLLFEIFHGDTSIFYSGDTGYFKKLENYVKGKDLALLEASYEGKEEYLEKIHLNKLTAEELGKKADKHILIHRGGN